MSVKLLMQRYLPARFEGRWVRALFVAGLVVAAMAASALAGAWAQSRRATAQIPPSVAQQASVGKQLARDEIYMRENVKLLAEKRSEEHTSELQSLMRISYAVFCLKKKKMDQ